LFSGIGITLAVWLLTGIPVWLSDLPNEVRGAWLLAWLAVGPVAGAVGGLALGQVSGWRPPPDRLYRTIPRGFGSIVRWLMRATIYWRNLLWLAVWTVGGLLFGLAAGLISRSATGIVFGLGVGLVIGVVAWLFAIVVLLLRAWVDPKETMSPIQLLRMDRATALREALTFGVSLSTMLWLVVRLSFERASGLPFREVYGRGLWVLNWLVVACGCTLAWMLFSTVYGGWLIARVWLAFTGRLPWSVMAFLADAHRRGALRQAGGVYQFRHARLRDHLATR
jgi:hypothetical protein